VAGALELVAGEASEVLLPRITQLIYAELLRGFLVGLTTLLVAGVGEPALDACVTDEEGEVREVRPFEVEWYGLGLKAAAAMRRVESASHRREAYLSWVIWASLDPMMGVVAPPTSAF
jgi:hypothetical protein